MGGKLLVINEWIFHALSGENKADAQQEAGRFLIAFEQSDDKIAVLYGCNAWMKKVHGLMEQVGSQINSSDDVRKFGKILINLMRTTDKCIHKTKWDVDAADIPQDAIAIAPRKDLYLIQLYYTAHADLLITSDHEFHDAFASRQDLGVNMMIRDDFLADYLQQN